MPAGRRAKILLLAVLALIVLFAAFLLEERVRGQLGLRHYVRSLAASGIKVSPADFVSHDPPEQNGADELWAAAKQFKKGGVLPDSRPPAMKLTSSGDAVVVFREADWVEDKATQHWAQVAIDLQTNTAQLDAVCRALSKPVLNNHLDFNKAPNFDFQPLSQAMQLTKWLGPAALSCLHEGKTSEAVKYLIAETRLPRSLAEDRILISELVRIAIAAVARGDTWEALQAGGFTDQDLSNLQAAWEQLTFATNMSESLQGEVVFGLKTTDEMRKSLKFTRGCLAQYAEEGGGEGDHNSVGLWLWRFAWLDQSEIDYLRADKEFIDLFHAAAAQKSLRTAQEETQRMLARHENRNFWDNLRYPFRQLVGIDARCVPRVFRAETERSTVLAAIALKRYSLKNGKHPKSLHELVPEFLSSVPVDWMDGQPLKYRLNPNGSFRLYSVGEDGHDDGGSSELTPTETADLWKRKDFVWPSPATPEETAAWRAQRAQE